MARRPANLEESWTTLNSACTELFNFIESGFAIPYRPSEYMLHYTTVYNLCTSKVDTSAKGPNIQETLYLRYQQVINKYLEEKVVPALKAQHGEGLLNEAVQRWVNHGLCIRVLIKIFVYLDRYYTKHNNRDGLRETGLKCFRESVYNHYVGELRSGILHKVMQEREGEVVDRSMLKNAINLFIEMGMDDLKVYERDFEAPFLAETAEFYRRESSKYISENSATEYMIKAEKRIMEEEQRAQSYLHANSQSPLMKAVEKELLSVHQRQLLDMENSGFIALIKNTKDEDLGRMYRLFNRLDKGLEPMALMFREYLTEEGTAIVKSQTVEGKEIEYQTYIPRLLDMHDRYGGLINRHFEKSAIFQKAMKDAFEHFVNAELVNGKTKGKQTTAELLSSFCDNLMKEGGKKLSDDSLEDTFERVVRLFSYISDKDLFNEFYRKQLSKRLLQSNTSDDTERQFISKLKMRCGASFTSKLEGMINDRNLSNETAGNFKDYLAKRSLALPLEFSAQVLTTGFWPPFKIDNLTPPEDFSRCMAAFKDYYDSRTQSRVLKWVHSLGSVSMRADFKKGTKEFSINEYQACALVLFDTAPRWSAGDIQKALNLPFDDIKRTLQSLALAKVQVLKKTTNTTTKEVTAADLFQVNYEFTDKLRKIKIPMIAAKDESSQSVSAVQEDRKHVIEAAIVRIMKMRKVLDHQQLILEVSQQLMMFKPDPKFIKKRIEDLITREYLERDKDSPNRYKYLA